MLLSDLISKTGIYGKADSSKITITDVCDDTRELVRGALFIAIHGKHFSPLSHIDEIEKSGAAALLLSSSETPPKTNIPCFFADDIREAASAVWEKYYGDPAKNLRLFAVTGTNGKTSTAMILAHFFNSAGINTAYIGTLGIYLGDTLWEENEGMTTPPPHRLYRILHALLLLGVQNVVIEVSSHAIAEKRTGRLCFDAVLFTNLTEDHLDYHKTMEDYFAVKKSLFKQTDHAIINTDDLYGEELFRELSCRKDSVGVINANADYHISELHENGTDSTQYLCCAPFGEFPVSYPLFGAFNVYNTLIAITAAVHAGLCPDQISHAAKSIKKPCGRLEKLPLPEGYNVIIDYAHTPDAMVKVLKITRRQTRGRLLALFGAGGDREREKRPMMGAIATELADMAFITADNPREEPLTQIFCDILSGIHPTRQNYILIPDRAQAIRQALSELTPEDTLLLLGKGHEEYLLVGREKIPFSEKKIVDAFIKEKSEK